MMIDLSDRIENALAAASRARIIAREGSYFVRAYNVQIGDLLDFEGDSIADTDATDESTRTGWESELSEVESVEGDDDESFIVVYTGGGNFNFPTSHEIEISLERNIAGNCYRCEICGHRHVARYDGDCRDDTYRFTDSELEDGLGPVDVKWFDTDWNGRELV
jgi:hypothetical protein